MYVNVNSLTKCNIAVSGTPLPEVRYRIKLCYIRRFHPLDFFWSNSTLTQVPSEASEIRQPNINLQFYRSKRTRICFVSRIQLCPTTSTIQSSCLID